MTFLGTVNPNRKGVPEELKKSKDKAVGSTLPLYHKDFMIISHVPVQNRVVIMLSSEHDLLENVIVDNKEKPLMIAEYNKYKAAVDTVDKMIKQYSCKRATRRYPLALFFYIIDVTTINASILFNLKHNSNKSRFSFIRQVGHDLIYPFIKQRLEANCLNGLHIRIRNNMRSTLLDKCLEGKTKSDNLMQHFLKRKQETLSEQSSNSSKNSRAGPYNCKECQRCGVVKKIRNQCDYCNEYFCPDHGTTKKSKLCIQCEDNY